MRAPLTAGSGNQCHSIFDNTGAEVCRVHNNLGDRFFIVTACNCHDDLVAALEKLAKLGEEGIKPDYQEWLTFHDKVAQIARAALAKAKENFK